MGQAASDHVVIAIAIRQWRRRLSACVKAGSGHFEHRLTFVNVLFVIFTALHGMQTRSNDENSVCSSVRPSVTRVNCDKTVERSVQIYIPYERTFSLVF